MIVREIDHRGGKRTERLVDYSTGDIVAEAPKERIADAWKGHYSLAMCARTPGHKQRITKALKAHGITAEFNEANMLKVNSMSDQRKKMRIVLGEKTRNYDSFY